MMLRPLISAACSLMLFASFAHATLPVVERMKPMGVVRGAESTVTLYGQRIGDAYKVLCDEPGIEILNVKAIDTKKVEVKLKSDPTLAPGLYPIRLVTKGGIANLRLLGVGAMPIAEESEPNNDFDAPQKIEINHTIEGVVDREDVDHYRVTLKKDQVLNVEIEGIRIAYSLRNQNILDPYIAILDEGRFELVSSDDSALLQQDGFCSLKAPKDGTYTILVRDSSFRGNRICGYRLHVGTFPRPVAVMPAGGQPGSTLKADLIDVENQAAKTSTKLPAKTIDRFPFVATNKNGVSPSPNWIRVNDLPVVLEKEPNDDRRKAPECKVPAALCGVIEKANDYDCFSFTAKKGKKYRVEVFARDLLRSPLDAVCNVFDPSAKTVSSNDDSRGKIDPYLEFTAKVDGKHTVRIYDQLRSGSPSHAYRAEVTMPQPEFDLTLKELRRDEAQVVSVPAGGQIGLMVTSARRGYNGEIRLDLDDLPPGISAKTFPIPPGRNEIPVLLSAAANAKHDATLFTINGRGDEKNFNVMGSLNQTHKLVLGQNRRHMWSYKTQRSAMAVTDKAPFSIELVQPKTPIVRRGSKQLTVKIKRDKGFVADVAVRTLYYPPGVAVNNSRRMRKGASTVEVPITANGGAAIGQWPVILTASYSTKNGTAYIASNPIMLDVQDSLFKVSFPKSSGELGGKSEVSIKVQAAREYKGDAEVELVGLPKGVTSPAPIQKIKPDADTVTFPIVIGKDAKVAKHKSLNCQVRVKVDKETITQTNGTGELRIDRPLPPKKAAPKVATSPKKKTEQGS